MRHILFAIIFLTLATAGYAQQSFVTIAPEPQHYAWWLRAEFRPFHKKVRGIPIGKIRSSWCKATEFRKGLFPSELHFDDTVSFAVDGFFDGSKIKQTALVGAYESCAGEKGTFLLILDWPRNGSRTIRFVKEMPNDRQFAVLRALPDSSIVFMPCMECDDASQLKWDGSKRRFIWHGLQPDAG